MSDDQRVYSDEQFALILRKASELAGQGEQATTSDGLTLAEMKAAATQAGFDPALVERAARMLSTNARATATERMLGGPLRHTMQVSLPLTLDEESASRLLSVVRISAGQSGDYAGHSSGIGLTWHDGDDMEPLHVVARPDSDGTRVSLTVDRRGTLVVTGLFSGMATFMLLLLGGVLHSEVTPAVGIATAVLGTGGVLAAARAYWATSTRKVRERMQALAEAIERGR